MPTHRIVRGSKITLTSPDPSTPATNSDHFVHSDTNSVEYVPNRQNQNGRRTEAENAPTEDSTMHLGTVEEVTYTLERDEL